MNKKKFILLALLLLCAYFYELFGGITVRQGCPEILSDRSPLWKALLQMHCKYAHAH